MNLAPSSALIGLSRRLTKIEEIAQLNDMLQDGRREVTEFRMEEEEEVCLSHFDCSEEPATCVYLKAFTLFQYYYTTRNNKF